MCFDTGLNVQESQLTLLLQQARLVSGKRPAQMFPTGTNALELPDGMALVENERGCFHYNPTQITRRDLLALSDMGRENEFLELGPYSKDDVIRRLLEGESSRAVTEYTPTGIEVRSAIGAESTIAEQVAFFKRTKDPENMLVLDLPDRVKRQMGLTQ